MAQVFTRERGMLSLSARGSRRASSKLGPLEPVHELLVCAELVEGKEVGRLVEARLNRVRLRMLDSIQRLDAFGTLMRWVRALLAPHQPDPSVFDLVSAALDALDDPELGSVGPVVLETGLALLSASGYELELQTCVRCGSLCPPESSALFDPAAGGIICRACGGGPSFLRARVRAAMARADRASLAGLDATESAVALDALERVIASRS